MSAPSPRPADDRLVAMARWLVSLDDESMAGARRAVTLDDIIGEARAALVAELAEVERLRARVTELENGEVRTEWSAWRGDVQQTETKSPPSERALRWWAEQGSDVVWKTRQVRTGPWTEVPS